MIEGGATEYIEIMLTFPPSLMCRGGSGGGTCTIKIEAEFAHYEEMTCWLGEDMEIPNVQVR